MTEEWHSNILINEEIVRASLQNQFPDLGIITEIKYLSEGWDNTVFLVNNHIIFRFPRRTVAAELIEQENTVLNQLPSFLNIEIPRPIYLGKATEQFPFAFHGYQYLTGKPSYLAALSIEERKASITILANFLKQLHSIDESEALTIGAKPQVWDRTDVSHAIATLTERVNKLISRKFCSINQDLFQQEISKVQKLSLPKHDKCLVHGDLDSRHLLFNSGILSGIIDWGDLGINNRAVDLGIIWDFYPTECQKIFFDIYGDVDQATWQYARFLGLYSGFTLLLYGKSIGDTLLEAEALAAIQRINSALVRGEI